MLDSANLGSPHLRMLALTGKGVELARKEVGPGSKHSGTDTRLKSIFASRTQNKRREIMKHKFLSVLGIVALLAGMLGEAPLC